jgi:hypothetical protein
METNDEKIQVETATEINEVKKAKDKIIKRDEFVSGFFLLIKGLIIFTILIITIQKNYFVYYKTQAIIGLIIGTSFFVFVLRKNDFIAPIIALILILFLEIVDTTLWRYAPFSFMFTVEDFSGVYKGKKVDEFTKRINNSENETSIGSKVYKDTYDFTMKIYQTGSKISIHSFSYKRDKDKIHESKSDRIIITKLENNEDYDFIYHFKDVGIPKNGRYSGTVNLNVQRTENDEFVMDGAFYTNRNPQTRGSFIELKKLGEGLPNPFDASRYLQD